MTTPTTTIEVPEWQATWLRQLAWTIQHHTEAQTATHDQAVLRDPHSRSMHVTYRVQTLAQAQQEATTAGSPPASAPPGAPTPLEEDPMAQSIREAAEEELRNGQP